jgi:Mg/Co/Ni transporter MgtE
MEIGLIYKHFSMTNSEYHYVVVMQILESSITKQRKAIARNLENNRDERIIHELYWNRWEKV